MSALIVIDKLIGKSVLHCATMFLFSIVALTYSLLHYLLLQTVKVQTTPYVFTNLQPGTHYNISVSVVYPGGHSPNSDSSTQVTVPAEPTVSIRGVAKYSFFFKWVLVKGATTYSYNCIHKESESQVGSGTTAGNEVLITSLQIQTDYVCYLRAANEAGSSNEVSAAVRTAKRDCESEPCQNGGTCIDHSEGYSCNCVLGFEGAYCEKDVDWCLTKECADNTTCTNFRTRAQCNCKEGFKGNAEVLCTPYCRRAVLQKDETGKNYTFPETWTNFKNFSEEKCPRGRSIASVQCTTTSFILEGILTYFTTFNTDTFIAVECEVEVKEVTQVNLTEVSSEQVEETAAILQVLTSDADSLTEEETTNAAEFIVDVTSALEENHVEITPVILIEIVTTTSHLTETFSTSSTPDPNPPGVTPVPSAGPPTTTLSPEAARKKEVELKQNLVMALSTLANDVTLPENSTGIKIETETIVAQILERPTQTNNDSEIQPSDSISFTPQIQPTYQGESVQPINITIPGRVVDLAGDKAKQEGNPLRITFFLHKDSSLFPSNQTVDKIVSAELAKGIVIRNLKEPIVVQHPGEKSKVEKSPKNNTFAEFTDLHCVFWNFSTASWEMDGCCLDFSKNFPECKCNHLTNFALIVSRVDVPADIILDIVSTVGCSLSIAGFIFTIILHLVKADTRKKRATQILLHVCVNLTAMYIIFLVGISRTTNRTVCYTFTALLHFLFLSSWCWMVVYSVDMYRSLVKVFGSEISHYMTKCIAFGYVTPALIVGINFAIAVGYFDAHQQANTCDRVPLAPKSEYMADNMCWLHKYSLYFGFLLPVGLMLICNLILFFIIIRKLTWKRTRVQSTAKKVSLQQNLVIAFSLVMLMGLTWTLGYVMLLSTDETFILIMSWLFTLANTIQGIVIFWLTCVRREDQFKFWWNPVTHRFRAVLGGMRSVTTTLQKHVHSQTYELSMVEAKSTTTTPSKSTVVTSFSSTSVFE